MNLKKILAQALVAICLVTGLAVTSSPAYAAPACKGYDNGCTGYDPAAQSCNDGKTLAYVAASGYYAELRYSATCYAAWVRVTSQGYWDPVADFYIATSPSKYRFTGHFSGGDAGQKWTKMVDFGYVVYACLDTFDSSNGFRTHQCTGKY